VQTARSTGRGACNWPPLCLIWFATLNALSIFASRRTKWCAKWDHGRGGIRGLAALFSHQRHLLSPMASTYHLRAPCAPTPDQKQARIRRAWATVSALASGWTFKFNTILATAIVQHHGVKRRAVRHLRMLVATYSSTLTVGRTLYWARCRMTPWRGNAQHDTVVDRDLGVVVFPF